MVNQKIYKLLSNSTASKFISRRWIKANDLLNGYYSFNKNISFETPTLRSDLCGYRDI